MERIGLDLAVVSFYMVIIFIFTLLGAAFGVFMASQKEHRERNK
jgi:phosphotransferase system  glucose/maltose/N-acetylglucosamine-specific IIC component